MSNERDLFVTGFVAMRPPRANLSFVSQSGSMGPMVVNTCEQRGIGLDKFLSVGNEAAVSAFDVLDYLRDDPGTHCAMLYLEGVSDGRHFFDVARRTTAVKPVVVLRGGRTEAGGRAAASHTAALAGSGAVFEAAARQAGVVTCASPGERVDLSACLAYLPLPHGRRVAVVTNGGGPGVLAADEVALNGLELADLPPDLMAALELLPPFWSHGNPLDLVTAGFGDVGLRVIELLARCETVDAVLALTFLGVPALRGATNDNRAHGQYHGFGEWEGHYLEHVVALMEETGKPIVNVPDHPVLGSILEFGDTVRPSHPVIGPGRRPRVGPHGLVCGLQTRRSREVNPIITAALNGPIATRANNPALPETPADIAASARGAYEAGAAVIHIHLRDEQGNMTTDLDVARRTVEMVREACPGIVQLSTGGMFEYEDRMKIVEARPAMATLNPCTMSFADAEFRNPPKQMQQLAARMIELGVKPEVEIYDIGHLGVTLDLLKKGLLLEPLQVSFVMGVKGGMPGDAMLLSYLVRELPRRHQLAGHRHRQGQPADDHHRAGDGRQRAHGHGGHAHGRIARARHVERSARGAACGRRPLGGPSAGDGGRGRGTAQAGAGSSGKAERQRAGRSVACPRSSGPRSRCAPCSLGSRN